MSSFARTKIQPPRARSGALLDRPALRMRLVEALNTRALVMLRAAAGYGKTSALVAALEALPAATATAWVSCDEGDGLEELLVALVAALEPHDLPWRVAPDALIAAVAGAPGEGDPRAERAFAAALVNALDAGEAPHGVIVLDDLHRIERPEVFRFLDALLERFTPRWTLAIGTREEPPLALGRLRVDGALCELTAADLQFDAAQARSLAARAGLDDEQAAKLFARTAGWPAGLQLAIAAWKRQAQGSVAPPATGAIDRPMFDFLVAEVLDRQPLPVRDFLLRTSVLPELDLARCTQLTGDLRAGQWLEAVERADLFVTALPGDEPALRLHDLFRAALEHRLLREKPDEVVPLLQRAAADEPDPQRRLGYLVRAQDWGGAARALRRVAPGWLTEGRLAPVQAWLQRFPADEAARLPDLLVVRALCAWMQWQFAPMRRCAESAAEAYRREGHALDALAADAYVVTALEGGDDAGDLAERRMRLGEAVDALLRERAPEMRGGTVWDAQEPGAIAALLHRQARLWGAFNGGQMDGVASAYAELLDLAEHVDGTETLFQVMPLHPWIGLQGMRDPLRRFVALARQRLGGTTSQLGVLVQAIDGGLRVWEGDVLAGREALREAAAEVRWSDFPLRGVLYSHTPLCAAHAILGDQPALEEDARVLQEALERAAAAPGGPQRLAGETFRLGRWLYAGGLVDAARRAWQPLSTAPGSVPAALTDSVQALLALDEGRLDEAVHGIRRLLGAAGSVPVLLGFDSELRLRGAAAALACGQPPETAAAWLGPVFDRHRGDADLAAVLLAGPPVLRVLAAASWAGRVGDADVAALQRWAAAAVALRAAAPASAGATGDPAGGDLLTEREREVVARLAEGESNKLIARALDLSPHTVKRHVANVLDKLDLRSRGEAAAWWRSRAAR